MNQQPTLVPGTAPSIRRRLLVMLLVPAVGILMLGTLIDFSTPATPIRQAYDQALLASALALADHVALNPNGMPRLALPSEAIAVLRADTADSIYFKITAPDGTYIAGDRDLPELPRSSSRTMHGYERYRNQPIRLVSYQAHSPAGPVTIAVAETLHKRDSARAKVLSTSLAVDLGEFGVILALILVGVRMALQPLRSVEAQIERRSARDLSPLSLETVPTEIHSIVQALNRLFGAVRATGDAQRRFLESAAHQLRTPLTGICAQLELMSVEQTEPLRTRLATVLAGARQLTHTTQQLLTLARSDEAANLNWEFATIDLAKLVEGVVTERLAAADMAGLDLGVDIQPATVGGVGWLLSEALGNLVNNAIAYTPAGGFVTVHCGLKNRAPYLQVTDNGVGILPAERQRVLDRFFRASNTRGVGSGLGLAIVREVAQLHGAAVSIEDGPHGKGTSFEILFPTHASRSHEGVH